MDCWPFIADAIRDVPHARLLLYQSFESYIRANPIGRTDGYV